jgi:hypothetical protein
LAAVDPEPDEPDEPLEPDEPEPDEPASVELDPSEPPDAPPEVVVCCLVLEGTRRASAVATAGVEDREVP